MALLYYFLVPGARDVAHYMQMHYRVSTSLVVRQSTACMASHCRLLLYDLFSA